ncbi:Ig-like domain-containing protein, partial [Algoriphagus sp.]|uniref:beta strand repeat-containing protein n=1 Tax=Algoriphagus sp. TaxID=1872435 RepID=UPI0027184AD2
MALALFFSQTTLVQAQTPVDQNFNSQPTDDSFNNTSTDINGVRYTGGPGANRFASVLEALDVSPNPAFTGRAILIGNNVSEAGGYAEFFTIDNSTNFKLVSLKIETYPESGEYATEYTIIGYDNGVQKVAVDVNMLSAGTYGSGNNAIVYSNLYSNGEGDKSGLLTFGSSWENIDQVRFRIKTPSSGFYWIGLDDIDFEPAVVPATAPSVTSNSATNLTSAGATLNGNVTADGGASVTARGFVYSSSDNMPTIGEGGVTNVADGSGTGAFSEAISGLSASTTYYYQAYATNSVGTSYGGVESFTTASAVPTVTDANISISGATGTGGAFKIGDTVTATWNNTAGGDNNSGITGVTVNFSQFGGGSAVVATNSSGTWTATYTISAGAIDAGNRNVSVTATNADESTTTDDTSNATVDNIAPVVSNASIGISGGTGTGGAFKIGDTVTATWDNSAFGDDNSDIVTGVTVDFSQFGGGAAVAATNNSDTWRATYTITAIGDDTSNRNVSVTATDNAGNKTTTADTTNATLENDPTTVSSVGVPANGVYIAGQNLDFTVNTSQNITVNSGGGTPRIALTVGSTTRYASYISGSGTSALTFRYTVQSGDLDTDGIAIAGEIEANGGTMKDGSGNDLVTSLNSVGSTVSVLVDAVAPNAPTNLNLTAGSDSGSSSTDDITNDNTPTITGQAEANATITLYDTDGTTVLGTTTSNGSGNWLMTSSALSDGAHSLTAKATDAAGNQSVASTALVVTIDTSPPVVTDANISISGATGTGGAFKIGDTVTATWNNTAGGDHNSDVMSSVTVDFSQFGGGAGVAATNSSGTWTATYTISAGAIDAVNRNISVTATDIAGNTTTTGDTSNATVDNVAPTVTDANISISGATGTGGTFKIGDTVTATWDNSAFGDDNSDTVTGVTFDFSQFGGGSAVLATNSSGTWTATYTITAGAIDASNRNVSVTAADNAGNATTTADTSNATVDNVAPIVSEFAPVNNATGVALQPTLIITFDDEVTLGNTGIFSLGKVDGDGCSITSILEFDLSDPDERSLFTLSDDKLTVSLILTENLPVNTQVILAIPTGFVTDLVGNSFVGFSAYTYTWSFTTINKLNQTITFPEIETKTYGDPTFTLGNAETDQGLTVTYTAADPTVVSITGNQATILKSGSTTITATQDGDEVTFAAEPVERTLTVGKKTLTITANDDSKTYGETYTFAGTEFTTEGLEDGDEVTSATLTSTGAPATAGVNDYDILISEAEGAGLSNYEITYVKGTLTVGKKTLTITANHDSKNYGETYTFAGTEFTTEVLEDGDEVT